MSVMKSENKKLIIIGESPKLKEVLRTADLVAGTDVPVLITGDTGTGKDLFAQRIHRESLRKQYPFVRFNCSSINDEKVAESVLFGSGDGGQTGSQGLISKARLGTLFLDNIEELSLSLQAKLLYFIENDEVQSSSLSSSKKYDVRVIAANNVSLHEKVEAGLFRAELYYRLNVIPLELPTLAEREADVVLLIEHFFRTFVREKRLSSPTFSKAALRQVRLYDWSGNVRELRNFCERMFILFTGREIDINNLPHEIKSYSKSKLKSDSPFSLPESGIKLESVEVDLMLQALDKTSGNKSQAARLLGLTRDTFLYRLKKYSIST